MDYTKGAVIYTRVSTGEQEKHGTSPETQLAACRAKALTLGLPIIAEYHDGGISGGFLLARPGMQAALADIQTGRAATLICPNISRYSRDVEHQQAIKKAVKSAGGHLVFCDMDFDDTPEGDMAFGFMGQFAQYERQTIRRRTMDGKAARAAEGRQPCRRPPYGYHIVTNAEVKCGLHPPDAAGQYLIIEERAAVVRRLFTDYAAGTSLNGLARALAAEGVPAPNGAPVWPLASLRYLMKNSAYKGEAAFGHRESRADEARLHQTHFRTGQPLKDMRRTRPRPPEAWIGIDCPALVSEELWDAVQARFVQNAYQLSGNPRRVYMLAGRAFCAHCGGTMTAWGGGHKRADGLPKPPRYICLRHAQAQAAGVAPFCSGWSRRVELVEADVREALLSLARSPSALDDAEAEYRREAPAPPAADVLRAELLALDTALSALTDQEAAAVQAQIAGIIAGASPNAYAAAFADIAARRKDLEGRRGALARQLGTTHTEGRKTGRKVETPTRAELETAALEDAALVLSAPDVPGSVKRDIISRIVSRVECGEETRVFVQKEFTQEKETENVTEIRNIVLIGFMGTGKSAVGRVLARRLGLRHLDTDAEIERAAGRTIARIFTEEGEPAFRARETALLQTLALSSLTGKGVGGLGPNSLILSTGGGTPLRPENAALLKEIGTVVWLQVAPEAIYARVRRSLHERPLLAGHRNDPLARITALLADRAPRYAALADHTLNTSDCADSEEAADRLAILLGLPL